MPPMATYLVRVRARFDAAHHLLTYRGTTEATHGHTWAVEAALQAGDLDQDGLAFDFVEARRALQEIAAELDHRDLNQVRPFDRRSPTTEHLAEWFHGRLAGRLSAARIAEVTVWEGPDCAVTYRP